jgi:hypothetical protein
VAVGTSQGALEAENLRLALSLLGRSLCRFTRCCQHCQTLRYICRTSLQGAYSETAATRTPAARHDVICAKRTSGVIELVHPCHATHDFGGIVVVAANTTAP